VRGRRLRKFEGFEKFERYKLRFRSSTSTPNFN